MKTTLLDFNETLAQMLEYGARTLRDKKEKGQLVWTKVEDRLPEHQGLVLVWEKREGSVDQFWNGMMNLAYCLNGHWVPRKIGEVTHWMELPSGPAEAK